MAVVPALAPGFAHSRFIMTQPPSYTEAKAGNTATTQRPQILTVRIFLRAIQAHIIINTR